MNTPVWRCVSRAWSGRNSFWFGIPATRGEQGFIGSQCLGSAEIATRPGGTEFELSTPDDYTILGVVLSEDVITRQANFLHNPDRVLHMLRNQSALEVKEQHKAALWGFVQQALATFCENPENLHQPAVRKVLGDNLLMAMGAMLEEAQPMVTAESISHQSYRRLLSRAREYVLENMSEPVTVLDLCNQLHVSRRTLQNAFHAILGIGPNAWLKRIRLNAVRRETDKSVVAKYDGKRRRHAVGILASGAICHGLPAAVFREAVTDAASADAGVGVRELHPIPDLNKLT